MSRVAIAIAIASLGCSMPRAVTPRIVDAGASDASESPDASRPSLGPVVPGAVLDGVDRTRDPACPASARFAVGVVGRVLDEDGTPRAGVLGQSCLLLEGGRNVCLPPARSGENGVFTIALDANVRCIHEVALRVLDPSAPLATVYAAVPDAPDDAVLFAPNDLVVYELHPAATLPPLGDTSSSRAVALAGIELTIAPAMLDEGTYEELSARVLEGADAASAGFLGDGQSFALLAALGPESPIDPAAPASFRVTRSSFAEGSRVDLFTLSGLYTTLPDGTMAREAQWLPLGSATVAADGAIAATGLTELGWIGVRPAR